MSDYPIISRDLIRAKARSAYQCGAGRDDHGFNWHATEAIKTWKQEWDRQHSLWAINRRKEAA
jgi:hypothetical protein